MPAPPGKQKLLFAALSLVFTYVFFLEYLRPVRSVTIPFDLPLFHYPLADYAFTSIRAGRFPLWDPTIYSGMPFAANTQAALFYPPQWLLFLSNAGRDHLSFWSLQEFVFAHVWLAFLLCYWWLAGRVSRTAAIFGAGSFAYGGYMMLQLQHLGFLAGLAWMPLGFRAVDEATEQERWGPLWKLAVASALCFLAGYIPMWFVFAVSVGTYAILSKRWMRVGAGVVVALGLSLLVSMAQLLPAIEFSMMREPEIRYGGGIKDPEFYLSYIIPNLFDFGMEVPSSTHPGREYLYLGAPAIVGLLFLLVPRRGTSTPVSAWMPLAGSLAVSAAFLTNPFNLVGGIVHSSTFLSSVCRDWCFLAGIPLPAAGLAALGLHRMEANRPKLWPRWTAIVSVVILLAWSLRGLLAWGSGGGSLAHGWASAVDSGVQVALFGAGILMVGRHSGFARTLLISALLVTSAIEFKIHGTSKRFNATRANTAWTAGRFEALDTAVYEQMLSTGPGRVVVDRTGPFPQLLRHVGLTTPQGFDPFLTTNYKSMIESLGGKFYTNWEFLVRPVDREALRVLGIRHIVTSQRGPLFEEAKKDERFALLQPANQFYKVFEYRDASPPFGWVDGGFDGLRAIHWRPERRIISFTAAAAPRRLYLSEQWAPGWTARVNGAPARVERWRGALQSVIIPPDSGQVEFLYQPAPVFWGMAISIVSTGVLAAAAVQSARRRRG